MAANITLTINDSATPQGGTALVGKISETGGTLISIDTNFPAGSTNVAQALMFTVANLQAFIAVSDQPLTIKTNSSGSPQDTINLQAGAMLRWSKSEGYFTVPFAGNVTSSFITCTNSARLRILALTNP